MRLRVKASFWPDAVICGLAHLYQTVIRQNVDPSKKQEHLSR
jgi:hypothetical protein